MSYEVKYPKARKEYTCSVCGEPILKGEEYQYYREATPWFMKPVRTHMKCIYRRGKRDE